MPENSNWQEPEPYGIPQPELQQEAKGWQAQPEQPQQEAQQPQPGQTPGYYTASSAYAQPGQSGYYAAPAAYAPPQPGYYAAPGVAVQPQKKGHGWIVAIVVVVCLFAFLAFGVASCNAAIGDSFSTGSRHGASLNLDRDAIGVITLDGTIQYDGSACSPEGLKELLDEAEDNDHIKAVVLRVNSGGGTATAGEEMTQYVKEFSKPIVVSSASINASAAYEISAQADYIFVAKSTEIGAIGTAMQLTDLSGLLDKLGVNMDTITSSDAKDSSYGYRSLTDGERAYYQDMVDQINQVFLENVAEGRKMDMSKVKELATGMPFTGMDAVKNGIADEIGLVEDAYEKAAELAGISKYSVVDISFSYSGLLSLEDLLWMSENGNSMDDLLGKLKEQGHDVVIH